MATDHDDTEIRRYLLGELEEEPSAALERDYFADETLLDRVSASEDAMVEEYLDGRLPAHQRERFEQHYLTSPAHQQRVTMVRQLRSRGASSRGGSTPQQTILRPSGRGWTPAWAAAFAAALIVLAVGGWWMIRSSPRAQPEPALRTGESSGPVQPPPNSTADPPARAPSTIAVTLSALTVRGADDPATVSIPRGTDLVLLHLEGDRTAPRFDGGRVVVRTVSGNEIWSGPAGAGSGSPSSLARADVPADRLRPDDYIVTLIETASGAGIERYRYFLRVRAR